MQICDQAEHAGLRLIAQQYIDNDGDYRVLVFGKKIALVIYRTRTDETTHLNNTSQGGRAELMPKTVLPESIRKKCITVAKLLKREVAGVDVVQDKQTGLWYCLEVNDSPQLTTGTYVNEKQAAFAKFIEDTLRR